MFKEIEIPKDQILLDMVCMLSKANEILRTEYQVYLNDDSDFLIQHKEDYSPVTQADLKVNSFLSEALMNMSNIPILSEEGNHTERATWQKFWLLDPLDGTKEFIEKRPEFTINLSLVEHSNTTFAAISVPEKQVIYLGYGNQLPLKFCLLSKKWFKYASHQSVQTVIRLGMSHRQKDLSDIRFFQAIQENHTVTVIRAGSAYKFCLMLEGEVDIYPRFHPTAEWDTSAGQCLLESIGGGLYSLKEKSFMYNQRATLINQGFIAVTQKKYKHLAFNILKSWD